MGTQLQAKVLHIETVKDWRGGQQQVQYLVEGLVKKGVSTALVCPPDSELARRFKLLELPFFSVKIGHAFDLKAARNIVRLIKDRDFNILQAHSSHALALALLVKTMLPGIKLVASRRVDFSVKKPLVGALKYNNPLVDRVVCVSQNVLRVLKNDGVKPQRLTVIHDGIDLQRFEKTRPEGLRKELQIPENHLIVGTVAALVGHKDYPTLLKAAQLVLKQQFNVTFCAVGAGGDRDPLLQLHQSLELGEGFKFVGFRKDVGRFFKLFDVFVLSSHMEGLGTSVLDALACGLPVVATAAGGIPEMIENGKNGLLVPPRNPQALAQAILKLLNDEPLRQTLARTGQKSVSRFSIENNVRLHIELYRELIKED